MVQKSGCNHTNRVTHHTIIKKGKYQFLKDVKNHLYFFKKAAKNSINESFKNSVG